MNRLWRFLTGRPPADLPFLRFGDSLFSGVAVIGATGSGKTTAPNSGGAP